MNLKMFAFNEDEGCATYISATSKEEAISVYKKYYGSDVFEDVSSAYGNTDDFIREMDMKETFVYYHDGINADEANIEQHIEKYCTKPDVFALSEF